jgi:RimJ/RimL family protein N-acetyltransferase
MTQNLKKFLLFPFFCSALLIDATYSSENVHFSTDEHTIITDRLIIRPLKLTDIEPWYKEMGEHSSNPFWDTSQTLDDVTKNFKTEFLPCFEQSWRHFPFGRHAVTIKNTNEYIGQIHFDFYLDQHGLTELSYSINKAHRKKGYCSEAIQGMLLHIKRHIGSNFSTVKDYNRDLNGELTCELYPAKKFNGIWARVKHDNIASLEIAKRYLNAGGYNAKTKDRLFFYGAGIDTTINPMEDSD